ncbi:citramalate synthase [Candidatus Calescamantes bacterium]|nr:citramalate synthase [Candidatus Calescamantes bacterium]
MKVWLYDTTLRDGAQMEGVSFSLQDKIKIARKLDAFGFPYIEGGWPGSNPKDIRFFQEMKRNPLKRAKLCAFTMTRRIKYIPSRDPSLRKALEAETPVITLFGKSWLLHVEQVLRISPKDNLKIIEDSVRYLKKKGREVIYDAEHFFDGFKDNSEYALKTLFAAEKGGADCLVLCDTNGGSLPFEMEEIIRRVKKEVKPPLGIHTHNDNGMAVANTIIAVKMGVSHVQGTINGLGERCGNADLCSVIPNLQLKMGIKCLPESSLRRLTELSHLVYEVANLIPLPHQPFVGESAFAHKGGTHVDAVRKVSRSFEHISPELVGNIRKILTSELSGRSNIILKAREFGIHLDKNSPQVEQLLNRIKTMESEGYEFEAADASLELLIREELGDTQEYFELEGFRVYVGEKKGRPFTEATVQIKVGEDIEHTAAEGNGPVDALTNALHKALLKFYPTLKELQLIDYKVRIVNPHKGTAATTRVLVRFKDPYRIFTTVGVSPNILEASWEALVNALNYKLLKDRELKAKNNK